MKFPRHFPYFTLFAVLSASPIRHAAAQFSSGSNGTYGQLNLTADTDLATLPLPPDGIFHCTTITIGSGRTLRFTKNAKNTPVYLLASGDVSISGIISVNGENGTTTVPGTGGPGGYDGGRGSNAGGQGAGWGHGPGGGRPGVSGIDPNGGVRGGSHRFNVTGVTGASYGNALLLPLTGGSGGGGRTDVGVGGGGGGGAILIASSTRIILNQGTLNAGLVQAIGGGAPANYYSGGSGGSIRLVAPVVSSTGAAAQIWASGGNSVPGVGDAPGSAGWMRIDTLNSGGLTMVPWTGSGSIGANMVVFPPALPKIEIIEAAGQAVEPDATSSPIIIVPSGGPLTQTVKVRVQNFGGAAALAVVLTPESGARTTVNLDIPPDTDEGTATVTFPLNVPTRVDAWTR